MVSLSKVRARCETARKDRKRAHAVFVCFCEARVWSSAYRDDGRWRVYTQSADSATVALTINCLFLPAFMYVCVCGVVNGLWCAAGQRYCRIHLIFLPPASHNLHPAAPLKPLCFKKNTHCCFVSLFLHTLLIIFMLRMRAYLLVNLPQHPLNLPL